MPVSVEVRQVESKSDFKTFFEFPWRLYEHDPNWVPPLLSVRKELLDREKNPAWEYLEGDHFIAWRGDKAVGTITALINKRHNEFQNEHIGWFGTFEVYDDQEAATALLDTAAEWVRSRGYDAIRGPQSFTTHEETGLLVENFSRPVILMPYNPPYYQHLIEAAGYKKNMDIYSFYINRETMRDAGMEDRLKKLTDYLKKRGKITVRPINRKNLKREFTLFKEIYNAAWIQNWGFTPMTERELDALVESLGQFFDPDLAFFAEVDGVPAGFVLAIPDLNQVLLRAYPRPGVPEVVTLVKAVWHWKIRPVMDWVRIPLMGVKQQFRDTGVVAVLFYHIMHRLFDSRYQHADAGWILENNHELMNITDALRAKRYKTHRYYQKDF
ncbi:MAG: hypothetical protein D6737_14555 [Chloroflexi bacterium]|nr:MAG: hypothetical protein D6737_14555 [Chloroflexota bacterium]